MRTQSGNAEPNLITQFIGNLKTYDVAEKVNTLIDNNAAQPRVRLDRRVGPRHGDCRIQFDRRVQVTIHFLLRRSGGR